MTDDSPQAFPRPAIRPGDAPGDGVQNGMSLRDYFAGQVVQGTADILDVTDQYAEIATTAYRIADALMAEREKGLSNG